MIDGLHAYLRTNGAKDLLTMEGGRLRYLNSTTWDVLDNGFTPDLDTNFVTCPLNDKVYIDNGTDYCHVWDRAATTKNACLTDKGAAFPYGKVRVWHKNHMFVLNTATLSGVTNYSRMYISDLGAPETFGGSDYVDMPGNGNLVTACDLGDSLVIFKDYSVSFLTGYGITDWIITTTNSNVVNIDESVGCISKRGAVRVGNEVWFIDREGAIRRIYQTDFDAFRKDILSTKINGTIANINKTQLEKAVAWVWDNKVYFAVPTGTSQVNDTVLVFDILAAKRLSAAGKVGEAWTVYTGWNPSVFASYPTSTTPDLYIGDAVLTKVYKHSGQNDNGVAIDARWDSKDDDFDKQDPYKRYKYGYINGVADSEDVDVGIYASVDLSPYAFLGNINLQGSGSRLGPTGTFLLGPTGTNRLGGGGRTIQRFIYTSGGGNPFGRTIRHSIRHDVINEQPIMGTFTSNFKMRGNR